MIQSTPFDVDPKRLSVKEIIQHKLVTTHFQAIIDLKAARNLGFEALVRTSPKIERIPPDQLFARADETDCLAELDHLCLFTALARSKVKKIESITFINVLPINLLALCEYFKEKAALKPLAGVALEISEKYPLDDFVELKSHIQILRQCGALIAIDDLGAGYAGLKVWSEVQPDFVKIDRHFINHIDTDNIKREFVRSILEIARGIGCQVIAEGIETESELAVVLSIGITLGQGYLMHRPEEYPTDQLAMGKISLQTKTSQRELLARPSEKISSIICKVTPLSPTDLVEDVYPLFSKDVSLHSMPVVKKGQPVGIVSRVQMLELFTNKNALIENTNKVIGSIMDRTPIVVDEQETLELLSYALTSKPNPDLNVGFIVTRDNEYVGMGTASDLLKHVTQNQNNHSRYSNPLTLLPGSVPVCEWLDDLLEAKNHFSLAHMSINHFALFNSIYGYSKGDDLIKLLADIITNHTVLGEEMVGHINSDNFVIVFRNENCEAKCNAILNDFKAAIPDFYNKQENESGFMRANHQAGQEVSARLASLAIGVVKPTTESCHSSNEVMSMAKSAKNEAMRFDDNHLFLSNP